MFHTTSSHLRLSILLVSGMISFATARMFKVENKCSYTVWPAIFTDLNVSKNGTKGPTGWEAPTGSGMSVEVPEDWTGRIWGRRDCNFNSPNPGPNSCVTGGCIGGLLCDPYSGTGVPPATLGEFRLSGSNGFDYYGVSIVDGYNIPMGITTNEK
ncbi:hypothetical protein FRC02_002282 [Tulasnella sp. 418]|nr:hypothetical protein FRC02_002282 [Tulasnella sp. 418]